MARIQIEFPSTLLYSTTIKIRITDLNYGGHLGNDSLLTLLHESRVQFLSHFGYSEKDIEGVGIIMFDVAIQYKSEAFYGELLTIDIAISECTRVSFEIFYRVTCEGRIVALAKTGIVCYDYTHKKVTAVPEAFVKKMGESIATRD